MDAGSADVDVQHFHGEVMYPLNAPSLTQAIDREIHRAVKLAQPRKYMAFRISDVTARSARMLSLLCVALYIVVYVGAFLLHLSATPEVEIAHSMLIESLVASMAIYVISGIVCNSMYKELEGLVRSSLYDVALSIKHADQ